MQVGVALVGDDLVQVICDRAYVAVNGPLIVVQNHNQTFGLLSDVVQRFEADAVGKRCVAGKGNHVFLTARQIARHRHAQRGRKRCAGMTRAVTVVLTLGAQGETIQTPGWRMVLNRSRRPVKSLWI